MLSETSSRCSLPLESVEGSRRSGGPPVTPPPDGSKGASSLDDLDRAAAIRRGWRRSGPRTGAGMAWTWWSPAVVPAAGRPGAAERVGEDETPERLSIIQPASGRNSRTRRAADSRGRGRGARVGSGPSRRLAPPVDGRSALPTRRFGPGRSDRGERLVGPTPVSWTVSSLGSMRMPVLPAVAPGDSGRRRPLFRRASGALRPVGRRSVRRRHWPDRQGSLRERLFGTRRSSNAAEPGGWRARAGRAGGSGSVAHPSGAPGAAALRPVG